MEELSANSFSTAVEVYDAVFNEGALQADYEASDLIYCTDLYGGYETEHFDQPGVPSTLGGLADLRLLSEYPIRFLWCAAFVTKST